MRIPPWQCTIGLGRPVVPDENRMYSGWANGTATNPGSPAPASSSSHGTAPGTAPATAPGSDWRYGSTTVARRSGRAARILATSSRRSISRPRWR